MTAGTCSAGHALSEAAGIDLLRTEPPVTEVTDVTPALLGRHKLLFAVQVYETVEPLRSLN